MSADVQASAMLVDSLSPPDATKIPSVKVGTSVASDVFGILHELLEGDPKTGAVSPVTTAKSIADAKPASIDVASAIWLATKVARSMQESSGKGWAELVAVTRLLLSSQSGDKSVLAKADLVEIVGEVEYKQLVGPSDDLSIVPEKRLRTRMYFTQTCFNLLREESEGFAKLICLLGDTARLREGEEDDVFIEKVVSHVFALIGKFHLEASKVVELILHSCFARIEFAPPKHLELPKLYIRLLDMFPKERVVTMVQHMLPLHWPEPDVLAEGSPGPSKGSGIQAATPANTPRALLLLVATLMRLGRLSLSDIWSDLYPSNTEIRRLNVRYGERLREISADKSNFKLDPRPSTMPPRVGSSDRNIFGAFPVCDAGPFASIGDVQKMDLLLVLIQHIRCQDVLMLFKMLSCDGNGAVDVACHPAIADALGKSTHAALGAAILGARDVLGLDTAADALVLEYAKSLDERGGVENGFLQSIPSREVLLSESDPRSQAVCSWLELLGPHARRFPDLMQDLCVLLNHESAVENPVAERILAQVLLPALTLTQSNCAVATGVWNVLSSWPYEKRWRMYHSLQSDAPRLYPHIALAYERATHEFKQIVKRLTTTNADQFGPTVAKITHGQALPVLEALCVYLCGYPADIESTVSPLVSVCQFNSELTADMTVYVVLSKLCDEFRPKLKEDGMNAAQWFANLSMFLAVFVRKIRSPVDGKRPQVDGVVHYLFNQVANVKDAMASVVLSDLLSHVAGVAPNNILSERQVRAHAGGPALVDATCGAFSTVGVNTAVAGTLLKPRQARDIRLAIIALRDAFLSTGQTAGLGIAIGQLCADVLTEMGDEEQQLKALSKLVDRTRALLMQYSRFIWHPEMAALAAELVDIGPARLISEFDLPPWGAFVLLRKSLDYVAIFPTAEPSGDVEMIDVVNDGCKGAVKSLPSSKVLAEMTESLDDRLKAAISPELFLTFWALDRGDLHVPVDTYNIEITRVEGAIKAWSEDADGLERKVRGNTGKSSPAVELRRMEALLNSLREEKSARSLRQNQIAACMESRKPGLVCSSFGKDRSYSGPDSSVEEVLMFIQHCVLPRCAVSATDASFCTYFIQRIMNMRVPLFNMALYFKTLLSIIPGKILCSSEVEAEHVGILLRDTLVMLDNWRTHSVEYDRECKHAGKGGFESSDSSAESGPKPMNHRDYCDWLFDLHESLTRSFEKALASEEYLMLRNTLGALTLVLDMFPKVSDHAHLLAERINTLRTESPLEDIRTSALALHARISISKTKTLRPHQFRLRPDTVAVPPPSSLEVLIVDPEHENTMEVSPGHTGTTSGKEQTGRADQPGSRKRPRPQDNDAQVESSAKHHRRDDSALSHPRRSPAESSGKGGDPGDRGGGRGSRRSSGNSRRGVADDMERKSPNEPTSQGDDRRSGRRGKSPPKREERTTEGNRRERGRREKDRDRVDRERDRDADSSQTRDRDRDRERDREPDRIAGRERDRGRDRERDRERGRDHEYDRERGRDRQHEAERDRERERDSQRRPDRERDRERDRKGHRDRDREQGVPFDHPRGPPRERDARMDLRDAREAGYGNPGPRRDIGDRVEQEAGLPPGPPPPGRRGGGPDMDRGVRHPDDHDRWDPSGPPGMRRGFDRPPDGPRPMDLRTRMEERGPPRGGPGTRTGPMPRDDRGGSMMRGDPGGPVMRSEQMRGDPPMRGEAGGIGRDHGPVPPPSRDFGNGRGPSRGRIDEHRRDRLPPDGGGLGPGQSPPLQPPAHPGGNDGGGRGRRGGGRYVHRRGNR